MSVTAAVVINKVRDLIPDPTYNASGVPQPDADGGLFRAQSLYRWLSDAVKAAMQGMGWVVVDWTALAATASQNLYTLDEKWMTVSDVLVNKWVLGPIEESLTIYPNNLLTSQQPLRYAQHGLAGALSLSFFPAPNTTDPTPTLSAGITASSTSLELSSTSGLLTDGYVRIDSELIKYQTRTTAPVGLGLLSRGQGGTTAAAHSLGATVTHCAIWAKGPRQPADISSSTSVLELPGPFIYLLELYVLSKARHAEQEYQEGRALMKEFQQELAMKKADPYWQSLDTFNVAPFGSPAMGPLGWNRVIIP